MNHVEFYEAFARIAEEACLPACAGIYEVILCFLFVLFNCLKGGNLIEFRE